MTGHQVLRPCAGQPSHPQPRWGQRCSSDTSEPNRRAVALVATVSAVAEKEPVGLESSWGNWATSWRQRAGAWF